MFILNQGIFIDQLCSAISLDYVNNKHYRNPAFQDLMEQ